MATADSEISHVQVKFVTKQEKYAVPATPFSVPDNVEVKELSDLINSLLERNEEEIIDFDFLVNGEFLRVSLAKYIEDSTATAEDVLEVEYVESEPAPAPYNSLLHDDWVSCVQASLCDRIVTGSYDTTLKLWTTSGECLASISGHTGPIKCVSWVRNTGDDYSFISGSHDQTLLLWTWDREKKSISCQCVCKGHAGSVESVAVDKKGERFISGSWDATLKIWSAGAPTAKDYNNDNDEHQSKKLKSEEKLPTRVPLMTLTGHKESVSACAWLDDREIISASWDHTMKLWDVEVGQEKNCLNGNKVFLDLDYSDLNNLILSASSDRHVRIWDHRTKEGAVVKGTYTSHNGWVTGVAWSPDNDYNFISGSYDMALKLWDTRSPKVPLYNMTGHDDRILCVDWTIPNLLISGGADSALKIFTKMPAQNGSTE